MFKNQLQELAQRSCFNLPSYACIREGPDHAPRFKASVNFNGEIFESPIYCPTLRQAEHAAAEIALNTLTALSARGPSSSLTARVLDETGIYKNLLQETAHRAGLNLPVYTTVRSGPGHVPIFTCTVELAGMNFNGEPAKTKKQAEKNAAIAAWSALKRMPNLDSLTNKEADNREDQDQAVVSRVLSSFKPKDDSKQFSRRRRDYNQAKRRMVRSNRDIGSTSSSTIANSLLHQQWRLMDLLMDSASDGSTQKQNSFVSLLPPPPPRTASKILPPTSSRDSPSNYSSNYRPIPMQISGKSEVKRPPPVEEHLKDEEEWLGVKQDHVMNKSIEKEGLSSSNLVSNSNVYGASTSGGTSSIYRPVPISSTGKLDTCMLDSTRRTEASQIISRLFGSPNPSQMAPTMARNMYTGGFNAHRIAPAVQIRSVIPVCAAPPPNRPQETTPSQLKEPSSTSLNTAAASSRSMSMQTGSTEVSSASSVLFNKSQPNSDQLSSELMNLQL